MTGNSLAVNRSLWSGLLIALVLLVAGCGGETSTTTTTNATVADHATATTRTAPDGTVSAVATIPGAKADPRPEPRGNGAKDFQAYVDETAPVLEPVMRFDGMVSRVQDAFDGLSSQPDESWEQAAGPANDIADDMAATAVAMEDVAPPRDMRTEHEALIRAYWASAAAFRSMATALREKDTGALREALDADQGETQPSEWVTAMGAHSEKLDVSLPAWLDQYVTLLG